MAPRKGYTSYEKEPVASGEQSASKQLSYAEELRRANEQSVKDNAAKAVAKAVPAYALPPGGSHARMSPADTAAVRRSADAYTSGNHMAPNTPIMGASPKVANAGMDLSSHPGPPANPTVLGPQLQAGPLTGPLGTPAMDAANLAQNRALYAPHDAIQPVATPRGPTAVTPGAGNAAPFRGSTGPEVAQFQAGDPTKALAGTGQTVITPYGAVASTTDKSGPTSLAERVSTPTYDEKGVQTGVGRASPSPQPNWQQQVVAQHPEIGVKDSPQNKAFLAAYNAEKTAKNLNPDGSPKDHMALAQQALGSAKGAAGAGPAATGVAQGNPDTAAKQAGKAIGEIPSQVAQGVGGNAVAGGNAAVQLGQQAVGAAKDFVAGVTGTPPQYSPTPNAPDVSGAGLAAAKAYGKIFHDSVGPIFHSAAGGGMGAAGSASGSPAYTPLGASTSTAPIGATPSPPVGQFEPPLLPETKFIPYSKTPTLPTGPKQPVPAMAFPTDKDTPAYGNF